MTETTDAAAIDPAARKLVSSALVADALDAIGYRDQCLSPSIAPLDPEMRVMGRALTVQVEVAAEVPEEPYVGLLRALDALGRDHVYVIPTGGDLRAAMWGELLATSELARAAELIPLNWHSFRRFLDADENND